jgi:hypothetical protein
MVLFSIACGIKRRFLSQDDLSKEKSLKENAILEESSSNEPLGIEPEFLSQRVLRKALRI